MSSKRKEVTARNKEILPRPNRTPRSLEIAQRGIKTGSQFAALMSALMSDLIEGSITPAVGNATSNAGGKLLKVVEMSYKYGTQTPDSNVRILELTRGE